MCGNLIPVRVGRVFRFYVRTQYLNMQNVSSKPAIIVFDLDRTLWPFQVDKDTANPFRRHGDTIVDSTGKKVSLFPGVPELLKGLVTRGFTLAVASRIEDIMGAFQLLHLFELTSVFTFKEIYPTSKVLHFREIQRKSDIHFNDMIFFDDDERNIKSVGRLGVTPFLVPEGGVSQNFVLECLAKFSVGNA